MFVDIEKGHRGGVTMPSNIVRVNKGSMSVSANIVTDRLQGVKGQERPSGTTVYKLGLAVDPEGKSIKLVPGAVGSFSFNTLAANRESIQVGLPASFRRLNMPKGDYLLSDDQNLVFTLAEGRTN